MRLIDQSYVAVKAFKKSAYFAMAGGKGKVFYPLFREPSSKSSKSYQSVITKTSVGSKASMKPKTQSTLSNNFTKSPLALLY